jgi:hypothetical protein
LIEDVDWLLVGWLVSLLLFLVAGCWLLVGFVILVVVILVIVILVVVILCCSVVSALLTFWFTFFINSAGRAVRQLKYCR